MARADPQPRVWCEPGGAGRGFSVLCPGEEPREGCLSGAAALRRLPAASGVRCSLFCQHALFQLKRFSQPLGKETSCVFILCDEVQDVRVLSGHVYRESAQTAPIHSGMAVTLE